jgi:hypothetical protein
VSDHIEIKGGAGEFDAAVIAVVVDQIARAESAARQKRGQRKAGLSAWVRAESQEQPGRPRERVWPDRGT